MPGQFVQQMQHLMPEGVILAPELITAINWLDDQGWAQSYTNEDGTTHYMPIYPADTFERFDVSMVSFGATHLPYTGHWSTPQIDVDARVVEIAGTSGDGGRAAIWVDDAGDQWFVHLGHDYVGVIGRDPLVLLQFLAMGYKEPGAMGVTDITPLQQDLDFDGAETVADLDPETGPTRPPLAFQEFLNKEFGITLPATARDLGIADFVYYGDEKSDDPFVKWLIKVTPPPTEEELAHIQELAKMAEDMDLSEFNLNDDEKPKGILGKLKGLFGSNK